MKQALNVLGTRAEVYRVDPKCRLAFQDGCADPVLPLTLDLGGHTLVEPEISAFVPETNGRHHWFVDTFEDRIITGQSI